MYYSANLMVYLCSLFVSYGIMLSLMSIYTKNVNGVLTNIFHIKVFHLVIIYVINHMSRMSWGNSKRNSAGVTTTPISREISEQRVTIDGTLPRG